MLHDRDIPVSVRRDVRGLGPRDLSAVGSPVPGGEREETREAGDFPAWGYASLRLVECERPGNECGTCVFERSGRGTRDCRGWRCVCEVAGTKLNVGIVCGAETRRHHGDGIWRAIRDPSDGHLLDLHRFHIQRVLLGPNRHIRGDGVPVSGDAVLDRELPVSSLFVCEFCGVCAFWRFV